MNKKEYMRFQQESSLRSRDEAYTRELNRTRGNARSAVRAWCQGHKFAEENARAVGNWPRER
jgi:hypothetical protein